MWLLGSPDVIAVPEVRTFSTDLFGNQTVSSRLVNRAAATITTKVVHPDSTLNEITVATDGLVVSQQTVRGLTTTFAYDSLRRPIAETDARRGTAKTGYYTTTTGAAGDHLVPTTATGANGQVAWREDAAGFRTTYSYSPADGRLVAETNALSKATYTVYNARGQVIRQWGPATYPVEYTYNDYGDRATLRTFRDTATVFAAESWGAGTYPSTAGDVTTWTYHAATGLLVAKTDAANRTVNYTYDVRRNLKTRAWARNVITTYDYHPATGEQSGITYSDGTPALTYAYNRLGQNTSVVQGAGGTALSTLLDRCVCGKVTRETLDPTFFGSQILTYKLDSTGVGTKGRTTGFQLGVPDSPALYADFTYAYDTLGRFQSLHQGSSYEFVNYTYVPNSGLIQTVDVAGGSQLFTYDDHRDHLKSVQSNAGRNLARVQYQIDALGRRTSALHDGELFARFSGGGHHSRYGYDDRSEVTSAQSWTGLDLNNESPASALGGRKFDFEFDPIGNRTTSKVDDRVTAYTPNELNQYASRTVPRAVDVTGLAAPSASVTVNGTAASRVGDYFYSTPTAPSNAAAWLTANIAATPGGTQTRNAYVPATPEIFVYDLDGNLTADSRWTYTWDAENRLTSMETTVAAYSVGVPRQFLSFKYDYLGRRIRKTVANWNGTAYVAAVDRKFIYDGWNLIAECDALTTLTMVRTYTWGLDISRTLADSGGVQGLLLVRDWATGQSHRTVYDGNGNLLGLVETASGAVSAQYEYSPFGETIRATGSYAAANPFRFSTKFTDDESGLVYYGRRYYDAKCGRFVGRDPKGEAGGTHLYAFVRNNPGNNWDYLGMEMLPKVKTNCNRTIERTEGGWIIRTECDDGSDPQEEYVPGESGDSFEDALRKSGGIKVRPGPEVTIASFDCDKVKGVMSGDLSAVKALKADNRGVYNAVSTAAYAYRMSVNLQNISGRTTDDAVSAEFGAAVIADSNDNGFRIGKGYFFPDGNNTGFSPEKFLRENPGATAFVHTHPWWIPGETRGNFSADDIRFALTAGVDLYVVGANAQIAVFAARDLNPTQRNEALSVVAGFESKNAPGNLDNEAMASLAVLGMSKKCP
jgi:RHS repeat-associated protein